MADFFAYSDEQDAVGRVIDSAVLKARCKGWLGQHWDHGFLVHEGDTNAIETLHLVEPCRLFLLPYNQTEENIARNFSTIEAHGKQLFNYFGRSIVMHIHLGLDGKFHLHRTPQRAQSM